MKQLLFVFCCLMGGFCGFAQSLPPNFNLIPNASMEFNVSFGGITDTNFVNNRHCWISANKGPAFFTGYVTWDQFPHSGAEFATIGTYGSTYNYITGVCADSPQVRGYVETKLMEPLIAGTSYFYTMYVGQNRGAWNTEAGIITNVGVYFSNEKLSDYTTYGRFHLTPQLNFSDWTITPAEGFTWVKLQGTYIASGGEQFLTIGNFDTCTDFQYIFPATGPILSLGITSALGIDDLSLVRDTTLPLISLDQFSLGPDTLLCPGESLTIGGQAHFFNYTWNTGDTTRFITVTEPGTYWCTVDFGCNTYTDTIHIFTPPAPGIALLPPDTTACAFPFTLYATIPLPHPVWDDGSTADSLVVSGPGVYYVTDIICGVVYSDTIQITGAPPPVQLGSDTLVCNNVPFGLLLNAGSGYQTYLWSNGSTSASITATDTGVYWVQATSLCGISTDTIRIGAIAVPQPNFPADTLGCNASHALTLTLPAGLSDIIWNTGGTGASITITTPGLYTVTAQTACGVFTDSIRVTFCDADIVSLYAAPDAICAPGCIQFGAAVSGFPETYEWQFEGGTPTTWSSEQPPMVCYEAAGTFTTRLIVSDNGASDTATIQVLVSPGPSSSFKDTVLSAAYGTTLALPACDVNAKARWYLNDSLICEDCPVLVTKASYFISDYYCVVGEMGCEDTCHYRVLVTDIPTDVWLPAAFTPNGDGRNDVFRVITNNPNVKVYDFMVYDRWGNRVYMGRNTDHGWDGAGYPVGVYFYYVRYKVLGHEEVFTLKGEVTLLR